MKIPALLGYGIQQCNRMLEPNTYECPIRTIRTYWAEILIFDKKMSCSAQYVRMAMTLKILQVLIILPLKIYKFTKDNSTHGNFVQGQLDPRQFRPRTTRPYSISSKDNSTNGNFVHIQSWLSLQGLVEGHPPPRRCYLRQLDQK